MRLDVLGCGARHARAVRERLEGRKVRAPRVYARRVWEIALTAAVLAVALAAAAGLARVGRRGVLGALALATVALGASASRPRGAPVAPDPFARVRPDALGYAGSAACHACHAPEHASWQRTYHHTMTRAPTPEALAEPCAASPASLTLDGVAFDLRCDAVGMSIASGGVERRVELTTGSHHYQVLWQTAPQGGALEPVPFVWLRRERQWAPRREMFLAPPGPDIYRVRWRSNCASCHATSPRPGRDRRAGTFETDVAELGIACEACHGPGADHAAQMRSPLARERARRSGQAPTDIVDPRRLSAERASMVCGQCHAVAYPKDEDDWWTRGYSRSYRPGEDLRASRTFLTPETLSAPGGPSMDAPVASMFFRDGTLRVTGRELHDVLASACHVRGAGDRQLSCLSCHSMHRGEPDRQLTPDREGARACASCHEPSRYESPAHTHHPESARTTCLGCHMPRTTYGLLGAIRAHRIDAPDVARGVATGRMNACNLCHVERSLAWTASALGRWYDRPPARDLPDDVSAVAWSALTGDAADRALAAAALGELEGRDPSRERAWRAAVLTRLRADPYAAVRRVAERALARLGPGAHADESRPLPAEVALPRTADGALDVGALDAWQRARDDRPVFLAE